MSKIIEAKAVISAADKTGNVFDRIAQKIKGVEKAAKSFGNLPNFVKSQIGTGSAFGFDKEIQKLASSAKEFEAVRRSIERSYSGFNQALFQNGPMRASKALGALDLWKKKTLANLREVQAGYDGASESHKKFFSHAGRFALHAAGIGGAAYMTGHGIRALAHSASERQREAVRYQQMGLTDAEQAEGNSVADQISAKYPSLSRTEVLKYLRTNASRLGGWDRSVAAADPYARAMIANKLSGGDEHEMEQVVRALEGMGKANTSDQLTHGLNAFAKAKAANPDYTGNDFAKDMRAASASKYAMSQDYMENVFPIIASHTQGFGNKLSTGMSALVGNRMTRQSRAKLEAAGLITDGKLIDEEGYIANNFEWTQKHVRPMLEKQGVHFGEEMTDADKTKVTQFASKSFSARNAADLIITNLLDQPLVERARKRKTLGLESMDGLQRKDSGLAYEGAKTQVGDLGTAILNLQPVISGLNLFADKLSGLTNTFNKGSTADKAGALIGTGLLGGGAAAGGVMAARSMYQWFTGAAALTGAATALDASAAALTAAAAQLAGGKPLAQVVDKVMGTGAGGAAAAGAGGGFASKAWGAGAAALPYVPGVALAAGIGGGLYAMHSSVEDAGYSGLTSGERMRRQRGGRSVREMLRQEWGYGTASPEVSDTMTYGTGIGGDKGPSSVSVSGTVEGQAELTIKLLPGTELISVVEQAKQAIKLAGQVNSNGPGSTGKSSPDAAAPAKANTGFSGVP